MSLSQLRAELLGMDLAINTLKAKRNSIISQIKLKEKPKPKAPLKNENPKFEKNLKLLRLGVTNKKKPNKEYELVSTDLNLEQLGRAGEVAFWNYLHEILDMEVCSINWVNKMTESRKPYDFVVTICGVEIYVDVKCTRGRDSQAIFMSSYERAFALDNSERYFVARLYQWQDAKKDNKYKADSFNVKMFTFEQADKKYKLS